jgi:hypothetical protein
VKPHVNTIIGFINNVVMNVIVGLSMDDALVNGFQTDDNHIGQLPQCLESRPVMTNFGFQAKFSFGFGMWVLD